MKARYEELSGFSVDEASDIAIRLKVLAGEIYNMETTLAWEKRQMFASTATGEQLDLLAAQRGLTRKPAAKAKGTLTFSLAETVDYPVSIPKGTVVATNEEIPVRIVTTEDSEIPQATYSVTVNAEAESEGYRGNIRYYAATIPVSVPAAISTVTNLHRFTGGRDVETDNALRERVVQSFVSVPNGVNAEFYKNLALAVDGVEKASVVPRNNGAGSAAIYVCGVNTQVTDDTLSRVRAVISENETIGANITAGKGTLQALDLTVTVKARTGYTSEEVHTKIETAFSDYLVSLPMGGRFYLSGLGRYMLDTGCIENYEYDMSMHDATASLTSCFIPGDVNIGVTV